MRGAAGQPARPLFVSLQQGIALPPYGLSLGHEHDLFQVFLSLGRGNHKRAVNRHCKLPAAPSTLGPGPECHANVYVRMKALPFSVSKCVTPRLEPQVNPSFLRGHPGGHQAEKLTTTHLTPPSECTHLTLPFFLSSPPIVTMAASDTTSLWPGQLQTTD